MLINMVGTSLYALPWCHWEQEEPLGAPCTCRGNSCPRPGQAASPEPAAAASCCPRALSGAQRAPACAAQGLWPAGMRTSELCLLLCLPSRNLLSGGNDMVLNKELLLFPIKQKLLPINHLIPELCSSISLSLLLSLHLFLTVLATHMSFNAASLQNGFLIK